MGRIRTGTFMGLMVVLMSGVSAVSVAEETTDLSFSRASVREAYREIAEVWGLDIVFESRMKPDRVSLELVDVTALEALQRLGATTGNAVVVGHDGGLLVMNDTPQSWREHTPVEVATFAPRYLGVRETERLLRSILEARRVDVNQSLGTVTVRDTATKICVTRRLLEALDHPPAQIDLAVTVMQTASPVPAAGKARLSAEEHRTLVAAPGSVELWATGLTLVGSSRAEMMTPATTELPGTLTLEVSGVHHHGTEAVTLQLDLEWSQPDGTAEGEEGVRAHTVQQAVRLADGEAVMLPLPWASPDGSLVVTVVPRVVQPSTLESTGFDAIAVGTEARVRGDCDPVVAAVRGARVQRAPVPVVGPERPPASSSRVDPDSSQDPVRR